jgi:hypothetical protein
MFVGDLGQAFSITVAREPRSDSLPDQNLTFETFGHYLGGIVNRHNLQLDTKAWHARVAELWLNDFPCLSYLVTDRSSFRQTITLREYISA